MTNDLDVYRVWCKEHEQDVSAANLVRASDPEEAARSWGERLDSEGDYPLANGNSRTVRVAKGDWSSVAGEFLTFVVAGEPTVIYTARQVEDIEDWGLQIVEGHE